MDSQLGPIGQLTRQAGTSTLRIPPGIFQLRGQRHAPDTTSGAGDGDMKKLLTSVPMAFRSPTRPTFPLSDESKRRVARRAVTSVATGNVRLQNGQYATKDDIDRKYERVKSTNFDDA